MSEQMGRVTLPAKLCETVNFSMMTGMPLLVTYWDENGVAATSWRGSTHVHEDGSLAMWIRAREGGLPKAIQKNARMMLAYRNPHTDSFVTFKGTARLETSEAGNDTIYQQSPPMEQAADPQQQGIGVVVTVERVAGKLDGEDILITA